MLVFVLRVVFCFFCRSLDSSLVSYDEKGFACFFHRPRFILHEYFDFRHL